VGGSRKLVPAAILLLLAGGGAPAAARAPGSGSDFSLSITPTRLVLPAGQLDQPHEVKVTNPGHEPVEVEVGNRDFIQRPDGSLTFQEHAPYSASTWVRALPARFRLEAGANLTVQLRIDLPANPDTGDHQVAVVFLVAGDSGAANVRVNRGLGLPVYLTVPGPVDDSMRLESLRAPGFALGGPLQLSATVRSTGTVHRDFRGPDSLQLRVGGQTVAFPEYTVTRGVAREVTLDWTDPPLFCICRATLAIRDGGTDVLSARIVVIPLHLVAGVLAGVLLLLAIARFARHRYRTRAADGTARGVRA
jgi:hypothetical protein